jgi:tRNA-Thr(GGU) m(6)t(6)A37 methyltransferase TsaA
MRWLSPRLDGLRGLFGLRIPPVPREPAVFRPIGVVRNRVRTPRMDGWEHVRSDLIFRDDLTDALDGIETYSHVIVVFHLHRVPEQERTTGRIHPRGDSRLPEQGVLATRSQRRPNAIGVSVVPLLRRRKNILRVRGLDAIDGTPVLDIKPYVPRYDSVTDAKVPDWTLRPPPA